jgi:Flp pilus assembly protein TadG
MTNLRAVMARLAAIRAENSGVAAIEFALVAMAFLVIVGGTLDLGMQIYVQEELGAALAAGAEYAAVNATDVGSTNGATLATAVANVVANVNGANWASSGVCINNGPQATANGGTAPTCSGTAASADDYYCPTGTAPGWNWGTGQSSGGAACPGAGIYGKFVIITASRNIAPLFPSFGFAASGPITRSVLVETQ